MTVSFDSSPLIDFREECERLIIGPQPGTAIADSNVTWRKSHE
jgi:hypothetical protein